MRLQFTSLANHTSDEFIAKWFLKFLFLFRSFAFAQV